MSARVEQARAALAEAEAATKAADEAHQAAKKAWGDARKELNAALIDADKDLPRVVVHSRGRYGAADSATEYVLHKRTAKSITVRSIGGNDTRQFRPSKPLCGVVEWSEYPSPRGWPSPHCWIDAPQEVES